MAEWTMDRSKIVSDVNGSFMIYKNKPLVREGNVVIYGSMEDKYILQLIIMSEKEYKGVNVPDKIAVQILSTDTSLSTSKRIIKQSLQDGFCNALDLGIVWLERQLAM